MTHEHEFHKTLLVDSLRDGVDLKSQLADAKTEIAELKRERDERDRQWMAVLHPGNEFSQIGRTYSTPEKYAVFKESADELEHEILEEANMLRLRLAMKRKEVATLRSRCTELLKATDELEAALKAAKGEAIDSTKP